MPSYRPRRVADSILRELSVRLPQELKDPGLPHVSITEVEVTRDLGVARVHVLPLGGDEVSPELQEALDEAARRLRGPIGRALRLRHAPELRFLPDHHTTEAVRMTSMLADLERQRRAAEGGGEE